MASICRRLEGETAPVSPPAVSFVMGTDNTETRFPGGRMRPSRYTYGRVQKDQNKVDLVGPLMRDRLQDTSRPRSGTVDSNVVITIKRSKRLLKKPGGNATHFGRYRSMGSLTFSLDAKVASTLCQRRLRPTRFLVTTDLREPSSQTLRSSLQQCAPSAPQ